MSKYGDNETVASGGAYGTSSIEHVAGQLQHIGDVQIAEGINFANDFLRILGEAAATATEVTMGAESDAIKDSVGSVHQAVEAAQAALEAAMQARENMRECANYLRGR